MIGERVSKSAKASPAKTSLPERVAFVSGRRLSVPHNLLWQQLATTPEPLRLQAKLTLGAPNDPYEREADQVADQVMRMPEPAVQRKCAACEEEEKDEAVQAKEEPGEIPALSPNAESRIQGLRGGGSPLPGPVRDYFEPRFGHDFSGVRIHTSPEAAETARSIHAQAYTVGTDIVFGGGRYAPSTPEGGRLLAHELTHVVQQSDANLAGEGTPLVQRRPAELIDNATFLGLTVGGGINATMRDRLVQVQNHLQQVYDALGPNHVDRVHFGGAAKTLQEWAEVRSIRGWRESRSNTSKHASGSAVDINADLQPYIATRTQEGDKTTYGGEAAGAHLQAERQAAVEVYDRAVQFVFNAPAADVSARRPQESTRAVYNRLRQASRALSYYFRHAFLEEPTTVLRPPIKNIESASEDDLLTAIPTKERKPEANAIAGLEIYMDEKFRTTHPGWTLSPRETYFRMLRDYEHVRIPMQRGDPAARPANTRNPTRGFLDLKPEVVEALVDVGLLRWGAADLGAHSSGDIHHFDLGNHGGVVPDGSAGGPAVQRKDVIQRQTIPEAPGLGTSKTTAPIATVSPQRQMNEELDRELVSIARARILLPWIHQRVLYSDSVFYLDDVMNNASLLAELDLTKDKELRNLIYPFRGNKLPKDTAQLFTEDATVDNLLRAPTKKDKDQVAEVLDLLYLHGEVVRLEGEKFLASIIPDRFERKSVQIERFAVKFKKRVAQRDPVNPVVATEVLPSGWAAGEEKQHKAEAEAVRQRQRVEKLLEAAPQGPQREALKKALARAKRQEAQDSGFHTFAEPVVRLLERLRKRNDKWRAGTYPLHWWGEFSVDIFLFAPVEGKGFWKQSAVRKFFSDLNAACEESSPPGKFAWKAIYNDTVIRAEMDELYGKGRVLDAKGHGPDKLHIHLDLRPLSVTKDEITGYDTEQGHVELPEQTP